MKSLPDVASCALPIEPWLPAEKDEAEGVKKGWQRKKVMSDIRDHTAAAFPAAQREQWAALDSFHDRFPTADSLTKLPILLTVPGADSTWVMQHGTPIDWRAAWADLARFPRSVFLLLEMCAPAACVCAAP